MEEVLMRCSRMTLFVFVLSNREWFYLLSKEVFNPYYGLFEYSARWVKQSTVVRIGYHFAVSPFSCSKITDHVKMFLDKKKCGAGAAGSCVTAHDR